MILLHDKVVAMCKHIFYLVAVILVIAGCASSPPPQRYLLDVGSFGTASAQHSLGKTLLVAMPTAAPGFDSDRIAYTREPPELDYYNHSAWSDTPAKMLLPILVRAFENTGAFDAVITPASPVLADLRVDIDLIRLQQELMTSPSQVRLTLRIRVVDLKSKRVLGTEVFDIVELTPSDDAFGTARAANTAIQRVLRKMIPLTLQSLD